jgi:hypothetical protein
MLHRVYQSMRVGHLTLFCYYRPYHIESVDANRTELKNVMASRMKRSENLKNMFFVNEK